MKYRGCIIKPNKDRDEYVAWSEMAEGPHFVGDAETMRKRLGPGHSAPEES